MRDITSPRQTHGGKGDTPRDVDQDKYASGFPECGAYNCKKMRKKNSFFCAEHAAEKLPTNPSDWASDWEVRPTPKDPKADPGCPKCKGTGWFTAICIDEYGEESMRMPCGCHLKWKKFRGTPHDNPASR